MAAGRRQPPQPGRGGRPGNSQLVHRSAQRYDSAAPAATLAVRIFVAPRPRELAMAERFRVRVTKDHLTFCSGHFITYAGHQCERLHGHNYRVAVEVEGPLDENFYVFDFIA